MLDTMRTATHVLRTTDAEIQIISFNSKNDVIGRIPCATRQGAIKALERLTGRRVVLKPMQTPQAERVETGLEIEDIPANDE